MTELSSKQLTDIAWRRIYSSRPYGWYDECIYIFTCDDEIAENLNET